MDYRRIPFHFTCTDPAKRQAELQKRFGLSPTLKDKMYIDLGNSGDMGSRKYESNSASSSPRLQHRVPIFTDACDQAYDPSFEAQPSNVDVGRKPRVRVVPIEIEGANNTKRHRNASGPPVHVDGKQLNGQFLPDEIAHCIKRPVMETAAAKAPNKPRVCNIPIKIESSNQKTKESHLAKVSTQQKQGSVLQKGCNVSKTNDKKVPQKTIFNVSLKKIESVLEKLKVYEAEVEKFSGTANEKQYRYLDEMLTRCMLDLDDIDTMGSEDVRLSRKAAIKKVQHCIDLLESKISSDSSEESTIVEVSVDKNTLIENYANSHPKNEDSDRTPVEGSANEVDKNESVLSVNIDIKKNEMDVEVTTSSLGLETEVPNIEIKDSSGEMNTDPEMLVEEPVEMESSVPQVMDLDQDDTAEIGSDIAIMEESCTLLLEKVSDMQGEDQNCISSSEENESTIEEPISSLETETTDISIMPCDGEMPHYKVLPECEVGSNNCVSDVKKYVTVNEISLQNDAQSNSSNVTVSDITHNSNHSNDYIENTSETLSNS